MLKSYIGIFFYYFLPSHLSYRLLNSKDKSTIDKANYTHNNFREDYYDPEKYQGGMSWHANNLVKNTDYRGYQNYLEKALKTNPKNILEVGFGTGFYTKNLVYHPSTEYYCGIDINHNFITFMKKILEDEHKDLKIDYELIQGDISKIKSNGKKFDLIVFLSSFHHIFHRKLVIDKLYNLSNKNGLIIMIEPSHYIPRLVKILIKGFSKYFKKKSWSKINNLSTHHFISVNEIKSYTKDKFNLQSINFLRQSNFANKYLIFIKNINKKFFLKFFSSELVIILKKINIQ